MANKPIIFTFPDYDHLVQPDGAFEASRFANGEVFIRLHTDVKSKLCIIVGSIAPPDENLLFVGALAHTLKKEGATRVTAVMPYLGYARQDKNEPDKSWGTPWAGGLLSVCGIDDIYTVDIHSQVAKDLFGVPVASVLPSDIWSREISELKSPEVTIVAPDEGALDRCKQVAQAAGVNREITYITKRRVDGVVHTDLIGDVTSKVVIVDDVIDTGGTLLSAAKHLYDAGAREITVAVTHGLFTGDLWQGIWSAGVTKLYCLDTTPQAKRMSHPQVKVLSTKTLMTSMLQKATLT